MPKKGYKQTEEHKEKIRQKNVNRKQSDETKKKIKENHADFSGKNNPMYKEKIKWMCLQCRIIKYLTPLEAKKRKFCSAECYNKTGRSAKSNEKRKKSLSGKKNGNWKGDAASKITMHQWVTKIKGKASDHKCIECGKQANDWSNKDHSYKRKLEDYSARCKKCHFKYDKKFNKICISKVIKTN